ncbi:hypothetical protein Q1695_000365 [Nippostrongylus brasiliensis]|nr:hypothetical protein Q1695_000365 [Nippostrongylus brasiliensis]
MEASFTEQIVAVLPGMACSEGELCRGDAQCRFGVCVCPAGQQLSGNECLAATRGLDNPIYVEIDRCCNCNLRECSRKARRNIS